MLLNCRCDVLQDIKTHAFFAGLDWEMLEQRKMEPPFKPVIV
jgi:hypothetical protein